MRSCLKKIILVATLLFSGYLISAQEDYTVSYKTVKPTCPTVGNGQMIVKISGVTGLYGTFDYFEIVLQNLDDNKILDTRTVSVTDSPDYDEVMFSGLTFGVRYIAYVNIHNALTDKTDYYEEDNVRTCVFQKPEFTSSASMTRSAGCNGEAVGQASLNIVGGVEPYTWEWYTEDGDKIGGESADATGLAEGKFYAKVTDAVGCEIESDPVEIEISEPTISASVSENVVCKGEHSGKATATVGNVYGEYHVLWYKEVGDEGEFTIITEDVSECSVLPAGDKIKVSVVDELGCRAETSIAVTEPEVGLILNELSRTDILCRDMVTGEISFVAENAIGAVEYTWDDDNTITEPARTGLAGDVEYTLSVKDEAGCEATETFKLKQPKAKVKVELEKGQQPTCYGYSDGSIEVKATGGTVKSAEDYTFEWRKKVGDDVSLLPFNSAILSDIPGGDETQYLIVAFDMNGCVSDTLLYSLPQPESMNPKSFINGEETNSLAMKCNAEKATVEIVVEGGTGKKTYDWGDGSFGTISKQDLEAGGYNINVKDASGCIEPLSVSIIEPEVIIITISESQSIPCNGEYGLLQADVTGGSGQYQYKWSTGSTELTSGLVKKGEYSISVSDENGCITKKKYELQQPDKLTLHISVSEETCTEVSLGTLLTEVAGGTPTYTYKWTQKESNNAKEETLIGNTSDELTNLEEEVTYKLVVSDANGCSAADSIDMKKLATYQLNVLQKTVSCNVTENTPADAPNTNDGALTARITGGFFPFTVTWSDGTSTKDFENIGGQQSIGKIWKTDEVYDSYDVEDNMSNVTIKNVPIGSYTATVTDYRGCVLTQTVDLGATPTMVVKKVSITPSACNISTGGASILMESGFGNGNSTDFTYIWYDTLNTKVLTGVGNEGRSVSGLPAQTYNVQIVDFAGCIIEVPVEIVQKTALKVTPMVINGTIHCMDGKTGSAIATASNDNKESAVFSFVWTDEAGNVEGNADKISGLPIGVHTVTVTDEEGCTASGSVEMVEADLLEIADASQSNVLCFGGSDGSISISQIVGGVEPYSLLWNTGDISYNVTDLKKGIYTVTVSDNSGCSIKKSFEITEPEKLAFSVSTTNLQCPGNCDGTATVTATGGTAPYQYEWGVGADVTVMTDPENTNMCLGEYSVSVYDVNGCPSEMQTVEITGRDERLMVSSVPGFVQPKCGEAPAGEITVNAVGSIKADASVGYSYYWTKNGSDFISSENTGNTNTISGLSSGMYALHITDETCTFDTVFVLKNSDMAATGELTFEEALCDGDSYTLHISNEETAGYHSYSWVNIETGETVSSTSRADGLKTGRYIISTLDNTECEFIMDATIEEKDLNLTLSTGNAKCYGISDGYIVPSITNTSGSVTYEWYNSADDQMIDSKADIDSIYIGAGEYYVKAYDANHTECKIQSEKIVISQPEKIIITASTAQMSYCKDNSGKISIEVAHGVAPFTFEIHKEDGSYARPNKKQNPRTVVFDRLYGDTPYTIIVTDADGCVQDTIKSIKDAPGFSLQGVLVEPVHCVGDATAELKVVVLAEDENTYEPYSYVWSHDEFETGDVASNLPSGNYKVTVTDAKGCKVPYDFDYVPDAIPMKLEFYENPGILCHGGKGNILVDVVAGGGGNYKYSWYDANNLEDALKVSEYPDLNNLSKGTYKVSIVDGYGCTGEGSYVLIEPAEIEAVFSIKATECGDNDAVGAVTLESISGGVDDSDFRFHWNDDTEWTDYSSGENRILSGLKAGEYYCTLTNSKNPDDCFVKKSMNTNPLLPMLIETKTTHTRCNYYTDEELLNNGSDGSIEVTKLLVSSGDYMVMQNENPDDYKYSWSDTFGQTSKKATNLIAGEYQVTVIAPNGCEKTFDAGEVGANIALTAEIIAPEDSSTVRKAICLGDSLELSSEVKARFFNGYMPSMEEVAFNWESVEENCSAVITNPTSSTTTMVTPLTKYYSDSTLIRMTYKIDGCTSRPAEFTIFHYDSLGFGIEVFDTLGVSKGTDSVLVVKDLRYLITPTEEPWYANQIGDDGIESITWRSYNPELTERGDFSDTVTNAKTYNRSGEYGILVKITEAEYVYAIAQSTRGCKERATIYFDVYSTSFVPTGFTPNGDGINDTWVIPYLINCPNAQVTVFNRWGELVFENKMEYYTHPWNGTAKNGNQLPMGTYYYVIEYNDKENTPTATGSVSIIR